MHSATAYEGVLFGFALFKSSERMVTRARSKSSDSMDLRKTLYSVVLHDNLLYFFGYEFVACLRALPLSLTGVFRVTCVLVFNNLMVVVRMLSLSSILAPSDEPMLPRRVLRTFHGLATGEPLSSRYLALGTQLTEARRLRRPFHAATGIMTVRMLIHLRKALIHQVPLGSGAAGTETHALRTFSTPASATLTWKAASAGQASTLA